MKKHLLIGMALSIGGAAFAQGSSVPVGVTPQKINPAAAKQAFPAQKGPGLGGPTDSFESTVSSLKPASPPAYYKSFGTPPVIGTTEYQLQTNAAICNRLQTHSDGTISATWTAAWLPSWADRGTGYNYFDGTSWGAIPSVRIENTRVGFTNVAVTGTGKEVVVTHEAPSSGTGNGTHLATRPAKGTGAWTDAVLMAANPDTWPRLVIGGPVATTNSLHIIAQSSGAATTVTPYHGQNGAITYTRSQDGGLTWDKLRTIIPQIDSSHYLGFNGDSYAMDIKGNTIAIVAGGFTVDVVLIKSTDNGTSWTKTIVHKFPIPMYTAATMVTDTGAVPDGVIDTVETNDASVAVLLDNSGNAHVWYGRMRVTCSSPGTASPAGLNYFPYTDGLMYWNETMVGVSPPVMIASVLDLNADGIMNIYTDPSGATLGIGTFNTAITSYPSAGIDATGKLFVTYSSVYEGINEQGQGVDFSSGSPVLIPISMAGKSFRHQYVMRSDDNGATWCTPMDITDPDKVSGSFDYHEGVYGAMARDVDANVHVIVQDDQSPGHGVSTTTTPDPQGGTANILYYKIPVADLACGAGVQENNGTVTDMNLYPNPTESTFVNLVLNSSKAAKTSVKIYNVVGQEIAHFDNNLNTGINKFNIDIANYKAGVYFVSAMVDGKNFTQKLIVK